MKTENEKLLSDLLADAAPTEFRAELLEHTLARVRRRKRNSGIARAALVFAAAGVVVAFWSEHAARVRKPFATVEGISMISSAPSRRTEQVTTLRGLVPVVPSMSAGFAIVKSNPAHPYYESLTDNELLALTPGHSGVLVRQRLSEAELLVMDPTTQLMTAAGESDRRNQDRRAE